MTLLAFQEVGLTLSAGGRRLRVLDEVSFEIAPGEAVGLVGESGAGKSLTGRLAMRLLPARASVDGDVRFRGASVLGMSPKQLRSLRAREMAMIFQDPRSHVNPVRKIGEFLTEGLRTSLGEARGPALQRVLGLLAEVGIDNPEQVVRQYPHELSGGMLQRVAIAAALAPEPALVIADEPTTALDVTTQSAFMALVGRLRKSRGLALLFISHDLALAAATCDRTLVMYGGRVVEDRASSALPAGTAHPYTAGLFASRPNLDKRLERLPSVPGAPQPAWEIDTPCVFAPRCRFAREICHTETPRLRTVGNGLVACHLSEDIREELEEIAEVTNA